MRNTALYRAALLLLAAALVLPLPASAEISTTVDSSLATSGEVTVRGNSTITGWEAVTVRTALDSPANHTGLYLLGTGNGDGFVTGTEAKAYADKAILSGIMKSAFDLGIIAVSEDGTALNATLKSIDFPDASGSVNSGSPLNVTFEVGFKAKFKQDKDTHEYAIVVNFKNVTYGVKFSAPGGWDIGRVQGLSKVKIVNTDKASYVSGLATGGGNRVQVEVKKESNWCCLVLAMGIVIGILVIIYFVFQRYKKGRETAMTQPEYVDTGGTAPVIIPGPQGPPSVERRIPEDKRTFGKEYYSEKKGGKDEE